MPDNPEVQNALAQLAATPSRLAHLTVEADDAILDAAPEGEWSARIVLAHLRDAEALEFRVGLERLVAEPNPALYFLPPDEWERERNRERDEKSVLLGDFALQRQASLNLITTMREEHWEHTAPGPRDEPITTAQFVQIWAGHDAAHLGQLEALLGDTVDEARERRARPPAGVAMPPSEPVDALTDVVARLDAVGVDYMLTGSAAACLYGVTRTPADIDFVVDLGHEQIEHLVESFSADHYIEPRAVAHAVEKGCAFNAIPLFRRLKADFAVLRDDPFDHAAFSRRQPVHREAGSVWAITPADLVLSNLRWARTRRAGQQLADVRTIMAAGQATEDDDFRRWIDQLGLHDALDASRTTRYDA